MIFDPDKHIRLEYSERDGLFHFAEVTEARSVYYPALINKISQNIAWDFTAYAFRLADRRSRRIPYMQMKALLTQWQARYMARKRKHPVVKEFYKLVYREDSRQFRMLSPAERDANSYEGLIANRVHIDDIIDFTENARRVFVDHEDYYPDRQAVRYALQMWIGYHAESAT